MCIKATCWMYSISNLIIITTSCRTEGSAPSDASKLKQVRSSTATGTSTGSSLVVKSLQRSTINIDQPMAVVSGSSAGQPHPWKVVYQQQQARGRLYGISSDAADGGSTMPKSGRVLENIHRSASVVYSSDGGDGGGGGGLGKWCGCFRGSGGFLPPVAVGRNTQGAKGREKGNVGHGGDIGVKLVKSLSGGFEGRRRSSTSPGKVSPLVEVVPPLDAVQESKSMEPAVFSMANLCVSAGVRALKFGDSGVLSSSLAIDAVDKSKASPTLFEMMTHEQELQGAKREHTISLTQQLTFQEKMNSFLSETSPGNQFNDTTTSDLKLTLNNREGCNVTVNMHRHILVSHSRFFAAKLSERWSKQQRFANPNLIEITDIDDVEICLETLRLMYCQDVRRSLLKENVSRVLAILKLSAHIMFEAGVLACLEYLEAVPWAEDEEEKVTALMAQLQLESVGVASDVMERCSALESSNSEDVLVRLLHSVTEGTDDKARREMKALVSRMLRENMAHNKEKEDVSKESLYRAGHGCLDSLLRLFMLSKIGDDRGMLVEISRQADNLHWLVDILIDRQIADDFIRMWAHQTELATLHSQVPVMFRYHVSSLTARLCIAIGKGQVLCPKDVRFLLLETWLQPLVDDFAWMQRCCRTLDKKTVEEGISQTILTLPLERQQSILLWWFDRFSCSGDECPNLQKAFEVWWRRTSTRPSIVESSLVHQDLER